MERFSRVSQIFLNPRCGRVRATKHAPRNPFRVLARRHCLAEIVDRGAGVLVERQTISQAMEVAREQLLKNVV